MIRPVFFDTFNMYCHIKYLFDSYGHVDSSLGISASFMIPKGIEASKQQGLIAEPSPPTGDGLSCSLRRQ